MPKIGRNIGIIVRKELPSVCKNLKKTVSDILHLFIKQDRIVFYKSGTLSFYANVELYCVELIIVTHTMTFSPIERIIMKKTWSSTSLGRIIGTEK